VSREYVLHRFQAPAALQIDYAGELNPQQFAAVTAKPGPSLVIAGAGAGKTRTLTYRVAYLIEQGVPPESILLLTFTNKAAREMMRRVSDLLSSDLGTLWGGTFHSMGNRVLRRHAETLGYPRDFTILDREDATDLVSACLGEAKIDVKATRFPKADVLAEVFSLAANVQLTIPEALARHFPTFEGLAETITDLQARYAERKRQTGVVDFDDLLGLWLRLLREHADVREHHQRRFQFILVDEYQDTNQIQSDLVDLLAAHHHNVMAVGDDSQSIYSWRGANFRNILRFPERHPHTTIYKIETNYRSTPQILNLANAAIAPNIHQFTKQLTPVRAAGPKPALVPCGDAHTQAAFVAQRALELREEGTSLNDMAVLYRSHFHALELQLELTRRNIPFTISSGIRFFEQAHVKDIGAYLKLVCNPHDEIAFKRVVRLLPGIGPVAANRLWDQFVKGLPPARRLSPPVAESPGQAGDTPAPLGPTELPVTTDDSSEVPSTEPPPVINRPQVSLARSFQALTGAVPKKTAVAWAQLTATLAQLEAKPARDSVAEMIRLLIEALYEEYLHTNYPNARARLEDLDQLASYGRQFASPQDFLTQLALLSNVDAEGETQAQADEERLRLSTVHQAKGLEFGVVFVIMLCDGLFPSARSAETMDGEEEERRLFYVAVTRARNELYLSYPAIRTLGASGADILQQPSRFLEAIEPDLVETWNLCPPGWGTGGELPLN
jgi:DNA helicase-2/ATP-dependent DNA helicase PcrA